MESDVSREKRLTRGIIVFHYGTGIDELESIRGETCVFGESLPEYGEFGIGRGKRDLEAEQARIRGR
jgi:hypothetical protein